mmetsp:Transcript_152160/g.386664  ORF Transcript_152160/g.386664 Transcript_152160/m.386664 type:complete len:382 (-) Transcript_152160:103-1248(-)
MRAASSASWDACLACCFFLHSASCFSFSRIQSASSRDTAGALGRTCTMPGPALAFALPATLAAFAAAFCCRALSARACSSASMSPISCSSSATSSSAARFAASASASSAARLASCSSRSRASRRASASLGPAAGAVAAPAAGAAGCCVGKRRGGASSATLRAASAPRIRRFFSRGFKLRLPARSSTFSTTSSKLHAPCSSTHAATSPSYFVRRNSSSHAARPRTISSLPPSCSASSSAGASCLEPVAAVAVAPAMFAVAAAAACGGEVAGDAPFSGSEYQYWSISAGVYWPAQSLCISAKVLATPSSGSTLRSSLAPPCRFGAGLADTHWPDSSRIFMASSRRAASCSWDSRQAIHSSSPNCISMPTSLPASSGYTCETIL